MRPWLAAASVVAAIGVGLAVLTGSDRATAPSPAPGPTQAAAVRTATRFLRGLDAATLLDRPTRRRFIARWSGQSAEPRLQRIYDDEAGRMALLDRAFSRAALLGYRVERLDGAKAEVAIWAVSLAGVDDGPAAIGWRTLTVSLLVEDRRWKVANVSEVPGPSISSGTALRSQARRFREYRVVP